MVGSSSRGRKTDSKPPLPCGHISDHGKGFGSKPRGQIRSWSPQGSSSLTSADSTGAKLYGFLPFPWITSVTWRGGTSVTWRGGTSVTWRGGPAAWATACFPYHPCPGMRPGVDFSRRRSMATRDRWMPRTYNFNE